MHSLTYAPLLGAQAARVIFERACLGNPYFFDCQVDADTLVTFDPIGPDSLKARALNADGIQVAGAIVTQEDAE